MRQFILAAIITGLSISTLSCNSRGVGFFHYVSTDNGATWSRSFMTIAGTTTEKVVDPGLLRLSNGEILLYYLAANGDNDPATSQPDNTWRIGLARSTDNGNSFTQESIVYSQETPMSDPEPLELDDGTFVVYTLNAEDNTIESFSSTGTDPTDFNTSLDTGDRAEASGTPGAIAIGGGTYHVYGCNAEGMIYFTTTDGQTLTQAGVSIDGVEGYIMCDASVQITDDGTYVMVYKLSDGGEHTPQSDLIFWADSDDGITFTPRDVIGYGSVPGFVIDQNGNWHVYVPNYEVD